MLKNEQNDNLQLLVTTYNKLVETKEINKINDSFTLLNFAKDNCPELRQKIDNLILDLVSNDGVDIVDQINGLVVQYNNYRIQNDYQEIFNVAQKLWVSNLKENYENVKNKKTNHRTIVIGNLSKITLKYFSYSITEKSGKKRLVNFFSHFFGEELGRRSVHISAIHKIFDLARNYKSFSALSNHLLKTFKVKISRQTLSKILNNSIIVWEREDRKPIDAKRLNIYTDSTVQRKNKSTEKHETYSAFVDVFDRNSQKIDQIEIIDTLDKNIDRKALKTFIQILNVT